MEFPAHWGAPPMIQTRDLRPLPAPFGGMGSGTLARWIAEKQAADATSGGDAGLVQTQSSQERQRAAEATSAQQRAEAEAAAVQQEIDRVRIQIAAETAGSSGPPPYPAHWGAPP
eukprot:SAG22_NODE_7694_length_716_cov_2.055105_1_plen_114_part_10